MQNIVICFSGLSLVSEKSAVFPIGLQVLLAQVRTLDAVFWCSSCFWVLFLVFSCFVSSGTFSRSLFEPSFLLTPSVTSQLDLVSQPSRFVLFCFQARFCLLGISETLRA